MQSREQKDLHLMAALDYARTRLPKAECEGFQRFLGAFYQRVAVADVLEMSPENLYGAAMAAWKLAAQRQPGEAKIRVYNPKIQEHGWKSSHTIIEIVNDDMPFLVDSVVGYLSRQQRNVHLVIHPVMTARRDADGVRMDASALQPEAETVDESVMHIQIGEQSDRTALRQLRDNILVVLADVRAAVSDWQPMLQRLDELLAELDNVPVLEQGGRYDAADLAETKAFAAWMRDNHFTFIGSRDYRVERNGTAAEGQDPENSYSLIPDSGLGILRDSTRTVLSGDAGGAVLAPMIRAFLDSENLLFITKTSARGTVHRAIHMDSIGFKRFDNKGNLIGERRFVGLFTSVAYNRSPTDIPLLRRKVGQIVARSGLEPTSHDGKALLNILETYPRDELFQIDIATMTATAIGIVELQERPQIRLFARADQFRRFYACLIFVPRERWSTTLRRRFERILLEAFNGRLSNYYTQIGDSPLARLHYIIGINAGSEPGVIDYDEIERRLVSAARSWQDDLLTALTDKFGEEDGYRLAQIYHSGFGAAYTEAFNADQALGDIGIIENLCGREDIGLNLYRMLEDAGDKVRLKVYHPGAPLALSTCLPMIENMGLRVLDETPFMVRRDEETEIAIQDFYLETPSGLELDLAAVKQIFETAFAQVWNGVVEDDGFNRLVIEAGLHWRDVAMLRAYCKYLRQTGIPFSQAYMEDTLSGNPAITRLLVALFHLHFETGPESKWSHSAQDKLTGEIEVAFDGVVSLDEDRILRRYLNAILATLRTNFFQTTAGGLAKPYLSFKFDSQAIDELPLPRPFREIFVYSPEVEAIHLRGGKVARGGLRWSDRREDFRTEILGLMKAQTVKNAVIVPVGSKGGFVSKRLPLGDRERMQAEVIRCYSTFIQGMLDITDNMSGLRIVPPQQVRRYDDDDPYLVVAADKGTASFSDIANDIAIQNNFWLGDAFASGGAKGYDHKKMGITAKGAWESVKRHFREMGRDIQNQAFTVIGVGDMSGDVFGNGMLLSRHCRLQAAFDHRHIFIDPDPDAESGYRERSRLFGMARSSWADYDRSLLSDGGGVFERTAKSVTLTPSIKAWLGLTADRLTPHELIHRLLQAEADLLWIGGIGTYVKASEESNGDVGDRANDIVRINGADLHCRVVGEGGNLGFTQRGRIEAAANGVRLNTDAIDNAGGVDCSDHEVNLKILLNAIVEDGEMTEKQRNRLLAEMTGDVSALVLQNNYIQSQALTIMAAQSPLMLDQQQHFIQMLERQGKLNRRLEALPDDEEMAELNAAGRGLSRPELAVLQAYAKMDLYTKLLESDLVEARYLTNDLVKYFPRLLRKNYREQILQHQLRSEIVATVTANSIINRAGITFISEMQKETGQTASAIARAYSVVRDAFKLRRIWNGIEMLDNQVDAVMQQTMHLATVELLRRATDWFLRAMPDGISVSRILERYEPGLTILSDNIVDIVGDLERKRLERKITVLTDGGVPETLAKQVAVLEPLAAGCDIVDVAVDSGKPVEDVGRVYFQLGNLLGLDWLRGEAEALETETRWERAAIDAIVEDLFSQQRALAYYVVSAVGDNSCLFAVDEWSKQHTNDIARGAAMVNEFRNSGGVDIAKLAVANRNIRRIIVG